MTLPTLSTAPPQSSRVRPVMAVTAAGVFMSLLDVTIVNIAFSDLARDLGGGSLSALSWVVSGYGIAFAAGLLPAGRLADRIGHRATFAGGVAVFGAASLVCGLALEPAWLVAARVAQALGAAALVPSAQAALLTAVPLERRGRALALLGATGAVAAATGPALGGALVGTFGWRSVFLVNVPVALVLFGAALRFLPSGGQRAAASPGATLVPALLAAGVLGIAVAIVQSTPWGWADPRTICAALLGLALVVLVLSLAVRGTRFRILQGDFPQRPVWVANAAGFAFAMGFFALLLVNALYLSDLFDDITVAGLALTPGAVTAASLAAAGGRLVDRSGARRVAMGGAALMSTGCLYLAARGVGGSYLSDLLPGMLITGAGIGLSLPALGTAAVSGVPGAQYGIASAVNACIRQLGGVLGIALLLAFLEAHGRTPAAFRIAWTGVAVAAALPGRARPPCRPPSSPPTPPGSTHEPPHARRRQPASRAEAHLRRRGRGR